jgi:hypothetical protein
MAGVGHESGENALFVRSRLNAEALSAGGGSRKKSAIQVPISYNSLWPANRNDVLVVAG